MTIDKLLSVYPKSYFLILRKKLLSLPEETVNKIFTKKNSYEHTEQFLDYLISDKQEYQPTTEVIDRLISQFIALDLALSQTFSPFRSVEPHYNKLKTIDYSRDRFISILNNSIKLLDYYSIKNNTNHDLKSALFATYIMVEEGKVVKASKSLDKPDLEEKRLPLLKLNDADLDKVLSFIERYSDSHSATCFKQWLKDGMIEKTINLRMTTKSFIRVLSHLDAFENQNKGQKKDRFIQPILSCLTFQGVTPRENYLKKNFKYSFKSQTNEFVIGNDADLTYQEFLNLLSS
jgi:hypothetical protein